MPSNSTSPAPSRERFLKFAEWGLAAIGIVILIVLKVLYISAMQVNSDEPQHLHVAWSWTQGLVQYRDVFDNHTPLFHLLSAPIVAALGERVDILFYMRLVMVPLFAGSLFCIYRITERLYDRRAGIWAAILAGLHPFYLLISSEYRTDNLWAFLWFIVLVLLLTGTLNFRRLFIAGLVLGAAFAVSMKTTLLLLAFGLAAILVWAARVWAGEKQLVRQLCRNGLALLAGTVIIPGGLFLYFVSQGALDAMHYCIIEHNIVPGMKPKGDMDRWSFPALFPLIVIAGWFYYHTAPNAVIGTRRAIAAMGAALSMVILMAYWPLVTRQDFIAITPPFLISFAPLLMGVVTRLRKTGSALLQQGIRPRGWAFLAVSLLLPIAAIAYEVERCDNLWRWDSEGLEKFEHNLAPKLALTKPGDYIFDAKGETIFRRRSYYYVLERVTQTRLKRDLMEDTSKEDVLSKNTTLICTSRIPRPLIKRLEPYYLPVISSVWMAGQFLEPDSSGTEANRFHLPVENDYVFMTKEGVIGGTLDGKAIKPGPVRLTSGDHEFVPDSSGKVAVILAQAIDAGYDPFRVVSKKNRPKVKRDRPKQVILTNPFSNKKIRR